MKGTFEGFKEELERCVDENDIDSICIRWLRLSCMEHGETGEHADTLLGVVEKMLDI